MILLAKKAETDAAWHFGDWRPGMYNYYAHKANMYRLRAAWYVKKMKE